MPTSAVADVRDPGRLFDDFNGKSENPRAPVSYAPKAKSIVDLNLHWRLHRGFHTLEGARPHGEDVADAGDRRQVRYAGLKAAMIRQFGSADAPTDPGAVKVSAGVAVAIAYHAGSGRSPAESPSRLLPRPRSRSRFSLTVRIALAITALATAGAAAAATAPTAPPMAKTAPSMSAADVEADFFDAARLGRIDVMEAFLRAGAQINARDKSGYTALILAAYNNQPEMVDFLIDRGADPCIGDNRGNTALMGVAFQGYDKIAERLLATDCDVNHVNILGQNALIMAAMFGRQNQIDMLLAKGADPAHRDGSGRTAAQVAAAQGQVALAARLSGATAH
jgi:hypothetical protein